ncbi:MAG: hypothetical protein QOF03_1444, partial [Alphaproteobacteria bacterium]|nr:hypothetical protein [Alphaproteobacteria bacterium]
MSRTGQNTKAFTRQAETTAKEERAIQKQVDKADKSAGPEETSDAMQAGARRYPESFPKQH